MSQGGSAGKLTSRRTLSIPRNAPTLSQTCKRSGGICAWTSQHGNRRRQKLDGIYLRIGSSPVRGGVDHSRLSRSNVKTSFFNPSLPRPPKKTRNFRNAVAE
eukprot:766741-Hanusia_phi.AAC.5